MATPIRWINGKPEICWCKNPAPGKTAGLGGKWNGTYKKVWTLLAIIHDGNGKAIGTLHFTQDRIRMDCDKPSGHTHPDFKKAFSSSLQQANNVAVAFVPFTSENLEASLKLLEGKKAYVLSTSILEKDGAPLDGVTFIGGQMDEIPGLEFLQVYRPAKPLTDAEIAAIAQGMEAEDNYDDRSFQNNVDNNEIKVRPNDTEPRKEGTGKNERWRRDPDKSSFAKYEAHYECQLDNRHLTFISIKGRPYVEAHHLVPIKHQDFVKDANLDTPENIVALCPTCHRCLHHGAAGEKLDKLKRLYNDNSVHLQAKRIIISLDELIRIYKC